MKLKDKFKREYRIWKALRARCNCHCFDNTKYRMNKIKCCNRWNSFANFIEDMGKCPEGYSIDRIDNNGNYEPSNCRWANQKTQCSNRGDFTPLIEYKGEKHILKDWCKILNKNYHTMYDRIHRLNMSFENALNYIDPRDKLLLWEGKYYTKKELSEKYNIPLSNFYDRRRKGWSLEKILLTPVIHKILSALYRNIKLTKVNKFVDMAAHFQSIISTAENMRDNINVFLIMHSEDIVSDNVIVGYKPSTVGKLIDNSYNPIEVVPMLLYSAVKYDENKNPIYGFYTHKCLDGNVEIPAKSPAEMFDKDFIPNDLGLVVKAMDEYYNG